MASEQENQHSGTVEIRLSPVHLFSHASRFKEAKGGYLDGTIQFEGLSDNQNLKQLELTCISDMHQSKQHCNFLHITGTGYKRHKKDINGSRGEKDWMISLINDNDVMALENNTHKYMKKEFNGNIWNNSTKTVKLGQGALQLTVGIPLSKNNNEFKNILLQRAESNVVDELTGLCKQGEPFMHLIRLKVVATFTDSAKITGISNLIVDKNRYHVKIGNIPGNIILNNSFLQRYTILLDKCMPPEKVTFSTRFVYEDLMDKEKVKRLVNENDIKVLYTHRTGHENKAVDIYFTTNSGDIMHSVLNGKYKLYLRLTVLEDGNLGSSPEYRQCIEKICFDEVKIGRCLEHYCHFDQTLRDPEVTSVISLFNKANKLLEEVEGEEGRLRCNVCYISMDHLKQLCEVQRDMKLDIGQKRKGEDHGIFVEMPIKMPRRDNNPDTTANQPMFNVGERTNFHGEPQNLLKDLLSIAIEDTINCRKTTPYDSPTGETTDTFPNAINHGYHPNLASSNNCTSEDINSSMIPNNNDIIDTNSKKLEEIPISIQTPPSSVLNEDIITPDFDYLFSHRCESIIVLSWIRVSPKLAYWLVFRRNFIIDYHY